MFRDIVISNSKDDLAQCLEIFISELQEIHQDVVWNYNSSKESLIAKLISGCQGVRDWATLLVRTASNFEVVASDLKSAGETFFAT